MNTIACLVVCVVVIAAFFSVPYILLRREAYKGPEMEKATRLLLELGLAVTFGLLIAVVSNLVVDLAQGYAALYVDQVGWPTL